MNLNLGCGNIILPGPRPGHHSAIDEALYAEPDWINADRNPASGVNQVMDAFRYPWPFKDASFDNVLLTHIVEHIPHEIKLTKQTLGEPLTETQLRWRLENAQDGWYAFMAEVYRVLKPGGIAHILSPYAWSQGAMTDPTHTRFITEQTFTHSLGMETVDSENAPFTYNNLGVKYEIVDTPLFRITELFQHLSDDPDALQLALQTQINVAYEIYVKLRKLE